MDNNKALWVFPNFRETINALPQKNRGRAWEVLIEIAFGNEIFAQNLQKEKLPVQIAVKSLLPLLKLRNKGGAPLGNQNNISGRRKEQVQSQPNSNPIVSQMLANSKPNVSQMLPNSNPIPFINNNNNINNNINNNFEKEKESKERSPRFKKPTVEELSAFCKENNLLNVDVQRFIDYYESKGWKVGNAPMKSWQAAARNWERMQRERKGAQENGVDYNKQNADTSKYDRIAGHKVYG